MSAPASPPDDVEMRTLRSEPNDEMSNDETQPQHAEPAKSADGDVETSSLGSELDYYAITYTYKKLIISLFSIVFFLVDVGTDIWVAVRFYREERKAEFALTLTFIVVPAIFISNISYTSRPLQERGIWKWPIRIIYLTPLLGQLSVYIQTIVYGLRYIRRDTITINRSSNTYSLIRTTYRAKTLRLREAFMESAPQLVLQLYILATEHNRLTTTEPLNLTVQVVSVCVSLSSLAYTLWSCQLDFDDDGFRMSALPLIIWYFCSIGSRVLAISLCATLLPVYVAIALICRWLNVLMYRDTHVMLYDRDVSCWLGLLLYNMVLGLGNIFNTDLQDLHDVPWLDHIKFYLLCLVENTYMILMWYVGADRTLSWKTPALALQLILSVFTMALPLYADCWLTGPRNPSSAYSRNLRRKFVSETQNAAQYGVTVR